MLTALRSALAALRSAPLLTGAVITGALLTLAATELHAAVRGATARDRTAAKAAATRRAAGVTLRGSRAAVDHAYSTAKRRGIPFARSRRDVMREAADGEYVALRRNAQSYRLKGVAVPYVRSATRAFVSAFASDYQQRCGAPLVVTSAMRPTSVRLPNSVQKSVHPTGMAVDLRIPRDGCRNWMRSSLLRLERQGAIDATEERHPAHFHVVVFRAP